MSPSRVPNASLYDSTCFYYPFFHTGKSFCRLYSHHPASSANLTFCYRVPLSRRVIALRRQLLFTNHYAKVSNRTGKSNNRNNLNSSYSNTDCNCIVLRSLYYTTASDNIAVVYIACITNVLANGGQRCESSGGRSCFDHYNQQIDIIILCKVIGLFAEHHYAYSICTERPDSRVEFYQLVFDGSLN